MHHPFFNEKLETLLYDIMPDIKSLYDKYHSIIAKVSEYKVGVETGKLYQIDKKGQTTLDRSLENEIQDILKDFFSKGKIVHRLFFNSELVKQDEFDLKKFAFGNAADFSKKKEEYIRNSDGRFLSIISLLGKANEEFLNELQEFRNESQKKPFKLEKFSIVHTEKGFTIIEPPLNNQPLTQKITSIYNGLLNLIEEIMALFIGIFIKKMSNGVAIVCENRQFDYSKQKFRFGLSIGGNLTSDECWRIV